MPEDADDIGTRIQALRKLRGFRTPRELASAIVGGNVTEAILQNIESGRKPDLTLSQFFNIALALRVAPSYLLVLLAHPDGAVDLVNASDELRDMTNLEFDSWLSGTDGFAYQSTRSDEHAERTQLRLLRELHREIGEHRRLSAIYEIETQGSNQPDFEVESPMLEDFENRIAESRTRILRLSSYLRSAGWSSSALGDLAS
jgi:transcriptional regulator with XRE-family HTH domain